MFPPCRCEVDFFEWFAPDARNGGKWQYVGYVQNLLELRCTLDFRIKHINTSSSFHKQQTADYSFDIHIFRTIYRHSNSSIAIDVHFFVFSIFLNLYLILHFQCFWLCALKDYIYIYIALNAKEREMPFSVFF